MMRMGLRGIFAALGMALAMVPGTSSACTKCHQVPCSYVPAPAPAYQCVTEMVPYQVCRIVPRVQWQSISETVMERVCDTTFIDRPRVVCRPVYSTTYVQQCVTACRPVTETFYVNQCVTVCRPVTSVQQVTEYCMQTAIQYVSVPVKSHGCGLCHKPTPCGCATVAQTVCTPVPVVRNVCVTQYVPEVQTRQIPVTRTRMVPETKTISVPVVSCRMVSEVVTDKIPVTTFRCVPRTITRQVPITTCERVVETCYRPVTRMVPVCPAPAPVPTYAAPQAVPSMQSAVPTKQS
ncbi:hypothetical protein ACYOEI_10965 [Singulisphaera rosea]